MLFIGSLFLALTTTAFAETLSQVIPGKWIGKYTIKTDPANDANDEYPSEVRLKRGQQAFTFHPDDCTNQEFGNQLIPLFKHAIQNKQKVNNEMSMRYQFASDGTVTTFYSSEYSTEGFATKFNCSFTQMEKVTIDDAKSELVDQTNGARTPVEIINHDEIILK